jgi:hypothetical protein
MKGALAADAEVGGGLGDHRLGVRKDETLKNACGSCRRPFRQVPVCVEHRESLEARLMRTLLRCYTVQANRSVKSWTPLSCRSS